MDCQKKKVLQAGIDFVRENLPGQHSLPASAVPVSRYCCLLQVNFPQLDTLIIEERKCV